MKFQLSIDRFEGDKKEIAVLLADDGTAINLPKRLLPRGSRAGDILGVAIERDPEATRSVTDQTRQVQAQLKKNDPGGDVTL